eukprot:TRINITY_DN5977_c0_g1_i1.p1 TRINITY_DN5977_c0_g1~~TRINITY_DN5977_c0_g1_i1.p1  ORF type:complete len:169 (+),score=21.20 TRINITY_DN5977_c0_g1_i1:60-566(+)
MDDDWSFVERLKSAFTWWTDVGEVRHVLGSFLAGGIFITAWLLFIDGAVIGSQEDKYKTIPWFMYLPGFGQTFVLLMMNIVSLNDMKLNEWSMDEGIVSKVRVWLLITFAIGFGWVGGSIWMLIGVYKDEAHVWPGLSVFFQTILIFLSSILWLFARKLSEEDSYESF